MSLPPPIIQIDQLPFSAWAEWANRVSIKDCNRPGVYLLARFGRIVPKQVDPAADAVVYVGETTQQVLAHRWYQFNRSAFEAKGGHSGGWTYGAAFTGPGHNAKALYVAALPCALGEPAASAYVRAVERAVIWAFVHRHGAMPVCNRK